MLSGSRFRFRALALGARAGIIGVAAFGRRDAQRASPRRRPRPSSRRPAARRSRRAAQAAPAAPEKDPREGDPGYEQAQRLMKAVDAILQDTAKNRGEARKLPSEKRLPR